MCDTIITKAISNLWKHLYWILNLTMNGTTFTTNCASKLERVKSAESDFNSSSNLSWKQMRRKLMGMVYFICSRRSRAYEVHHLDEFATQKRHRRNKKKGLTFLQERDHCTPGNLVKIFRTQACAYSNNFPQIFAVCKLSLFHAQTIFDPKTLAVYI